MSWYGLLQIHAAPAVQRSDTAALTRREVEIATLISQGLSNKEIAIRLSIAVHTVKSHVHSVLLKLKLSTRLEIAVKVHTDDRTVRLAQIEQVA